MQMPWKTQGRNDLSQFKLETGSETNWDAITQKLIMSCCWYIAQGGRIGDFRSLQGEDYSGSMRRALTQPGCEFTWYRKGSMRRKFLSEVIRHYIAGVVCLQHLGVEKQENK